MSTVSECGIVNTFTLLSIISTVFSVILLIFTIPLNILLIYVTIKTRNGKSKGFFFKLLLNIAFADLMTGLIVDPTSMNYLIKEALQQHISLGEVYLLHLSLFITDAIALITMTLLSFDRIIALVYPLKYHRGMKNWKENMLVVLIYPLSILLVLPYIKIKFIGQLAVFTGTNVGVAIMSLAITTAVFKMNSKKENLKKNTSNVVASTNVENSTKKLSEIPPEKLINNSTSRINMQNKVTKAFFIMICLFIAMYLPMCVTMLYMNTCGENCNCYAVHIMRDFSYTSILASSLFRPLNFLLTLGQLRRYTAHILSKRDTSSSSQNFASTQS